MTPPPADALPRRMLVAVVISYLAAAAPWVWWLGRMSLSREPSVEAGAANLSQLGPFWIGAGLMWLALTALALLLVRATARPTRDFEWSVAGFVLAIAVALRIVVVLTTEPTLSDDIWRYLFDGRTIASGSTPYLVAPAEVDPEHPRFAHEVELARRINHPQLVSLYLPSSQLVFAGAALVTPEVSDLFTATVWLRMLLVTFEIGAMAVIALALRRVRRSAWWLALYAWHPLAISEIAGAGHQEAIGLALMMLALFIASARPWRVTTWTVPLAFAALVKPVVVPLAAMALRNQPARRWLVSMVVSAVACVALMAPFVLTHHLVPLERLLDTADRFLSAWAFNGSVYQIALLLTDGWLQLSRFICAVILAAIFIGILWRCRDLWTGARVFLFAALLLSTTAHPWYLLWALILAPIAPSPAVWVASLTLPWGYVVLGDVVGWTVPPWAPWVTYAPVYLTLALDLIWRKSNARRAE